MKKIAWVAGVAVVVVCCIGLWRWRVSPPKPSTSHDPFHVGYPDSPEKPEFPREAELIVLEHWDAVVAAKWSTSRASVERQAREDLAVSLLYGRLASRPQLSLFRRNGICFA